MESVHDVCVCRYDTDAKLSDEESDDGGRAEEEAPKAKKRKAPSKPAAPAKRQRKEVSCWHALWLCVYCMCESIG